MLSFELRQREMRRVRFAMLRRARRRMHARWVPREAFGCRHCFETESSQSPPLSRNVPSPLSAESPAPVRITMFENRIARARA